MDEYIKREAALALVKPDAPEDEKAAVTIATAKKLVRSIVCRTPAADVVPVVRCKDCKHYRTYMGRDMCAKNAQLLGGREVGLCATGKDDFCSYGERGKR